MHEATVGSTVILPGGYRAEIVQIITNYFDMEYKNEGINPYSHGEKNPYNFEVIYKLKRIRE